MKGEIAALLCKLNFDGCECGVENMAACQDPPCRCREFARSLVKADVRIVPKDSVVVPRVLLDEVRSFAMSRVIALGGRPERSVVVVPRVPTQAMLDAAQEAEDLVNGGFLDGDSFGPADIWRAMCIAASTGG